MIADICGRVKATLKRYNKWYRAEGCAQLGSSIQFFPYVAFFLAAGLMAGDKNRFVLVAAAIILVILGLVPKFAMLC